MSIEKRGNTCATSFAKQFDGGTLHPGSMFDSVEPRRASRVATPSLEQAKQLLEAAQFIASHRAQVARLSGANFNVFRVLRMEGDEVRLHSRFIAELLDPRGSHGQGSAFLEMFLGQVDCTLLGDSRIDVTEARVEAPHYIGPTLWKDEDSTGGSIDIFITDNARHISIENKIESPEGRHQVDRYCNYRRKRNFVLFLTPDGGCANTKKCNYAPISYAEHIIPWLECCHRHCTDLPALRESIKQYLFLVRELTNGDPLMNEVDEDVKRLLRKNVEAAHLVYRHFMPTIYEAVGACGGGAAGRIADPGPGLRHRARPHTGRPRGSDGGRGG